MSDAPTATNIAADYLEDLLFGKNAGTKLPSEGEMVAASGVSRTMLRESLIRLSQADRVYSEKGAGWFVGSASSVRLPAPHLDEDRRGLFLLMMSQCARKVAERVSEKQRGVKPQLVKLKSLLENAVAEVSSGSAEGSIALWRCHQRMISMSGDKLLYSALGQLRPRHFDRADAKATQNLVGFAERGDPYAPISECLHAQAGSSRRPSSGSLGLSLSYGRTKLKGVAAFNLKNAATPPGGVVQSTLKSLRAA